MIRARTADPLPMNLTCAWPTTAVTRSCHCCRLLLQYALFAARLGLPPAAAMLLQDMPLQHPQREGLLACCCYCRRRCCCCCAAATAADPHLLQQQPNRLGEQ
jgi:hypothetical protein